MIGPARAETMMLGHGKIQMGGIKNFEHLKSIGIQADAHQFKDFYHRILKMHFSMPGIGQLHLIGNFF